MINKTILRVGSAVALALTAYGCNNDKITALNKNPNSPEDVPPGPLFTEAARLTTSRWFGAIDLRAHEWVVQQLAEVQYDDEDRYIRVHATDTEGTWNGAYSSELKDLTQIIAKGQASGDAGIYAPAVALRTLGFDFITDAWGDAPYTEALKGDSVGSSLTPAYDTQQAIYTSFFASLDKASTDLVGASNMPSAARIRSMAEARPRGRSSSTRCVHVSRCGSATRIRRSPALSWRPRWPRLAA